MGLHVLEKGIFIEEPLFHKFEEIENQSLRRWLQGSAHLFYFAYLSSVRGGMIYLQALFQSLEHDERGIDLCTPDLGFFINGAPESLLTGNFNIQRIEVHWGEMVSCLELSSIGKIVRILVPGRLTPQDVERLIALSGPFVGVRGNQSLSEALSYGKVFFFDGRPHNWFLIKDLLALAENRISDHKSSLTCLRMMREAMVHEMPKEEGDFVDERAFQEEELTWSQIAEALGKALQDPDTLIGYQKLGQIVREEHSFNEFLVDFASRTFMHRIHPGLAGEEATLIEQFAQEKISLTTLISALRNKRDSLFQ